MTNGRRSAPRASVASYPKTTNLAGGVTARRAGASLLQNENQNPNDFSSSAGRTIRRQSRAQRDTKTTNLAGAVTARRAGASLPHKHKHKRFCPTNTNAFVFAFAFVVFVCVCGFRFATAHAGINLSSVISAGANTRIGGPQNPVPRDTYSCASPRKCSPARYGCTSATSHENGQICPPCVCPHKVSH